MTTLYDRAGIIAGRSMTRSKAVFGKFAVDAHGAYVVDVDGVERIDMLCALGAVSLGYRKAGPIVGVMSLPDKREVEAAEIVVRERVAPWASSVRFLMTGSEATHAALRIAKKVTGRNLALMGDWAYHGQQEWSADPDYPLTKRFKHGADIDWWLACDPSRNNIAAVFIEPHRWEAIDVEWLRSVRAWCDRTGALLVFDEIIYGGRWALGGATELYGVVPDLACFSKALWNGQPGSCIVGNAALAEHGEMISGTFSGAPIGLSSVIDTVQTYKREPVIETMWARGRQLAEGLDAILPKDLGIREGSPVHQRIHWFNEDHGKQFMHAMADRGVIFHPLVVNIMYAHTEQHIDQVLEAATESLKELR
jgi:glutamate-1-semialdehyde 2,1-aminomutase